VPYVGRKHGLSTLLRLRKWVFLGTGENAFVDFSGDFSVLSRIGNYIRSENVCQEVAVILRRWRVGQILMPASESCLLASAVFLLILI
jgi:hypothetical protein